MAGLLPLLTSDTLFTCPRCGALNTVRLIATGPLTGRCTACEHPYAFTPGSPSTTTSGVANFAGATVLTVVSGSSFSTVGAWIVVDSASADGGVEILKSSAVGTATTIPVASSPLRLTHAAGATVQSATLAPLGPLT